MNVNGEKNSNTVASNTTTSSINDNIVTQTSNYQSYAFRSLSQSFR